MFLLLLYFSAAALKSQGQAVDSKRAPAGDAPVPITLGQSVVPLYGPWKFHIGDDPRWADPSFDDSQWETVDLIPTPQTTLRAVPIAVDRISGVSNGAAVFLVIAISAALGWKRAERRDWPLLAALFFFSFQVFEPVLELLHIRTSWQPFGVLHPP